MMRNSIITLLRVAETNLLYCFKDMKPDEVHKRVHEELNSVSWILGHCFGHFHLVLCDTCMKSKMLSKDMLHYFRYGTTKEEIDSTKFSCTFEELVDEYLKMSETGFDYLKSLKDEDYQQLLFPKVDETLEKALQKMALHYLGHVGQIVLIRKHLGNPGYSFVGGFHMKELRWMRNGWNSWWEATKQDFNL
jgi:hypothetical protein